VQIAVAIGPRVMADAPRSRVGGERLGDGRTHDRDVGVDGQQAFHFALGHRPAADDQARPTRELEDDREEPHQPSTP
jgi:hypothetical protein